eukprot:TRINITY_DN7789_c2_g1_i1.p1 TRINITY_DN7789_c2_g1~~TRINITY_DN7789_c2_g1_i1.p1  ORF type:complete len:116 (+),score=19.42 TRINITY_DN7789_c2_g1_i1:101-448(+)
MKAASCLNPHFAKPLALDYKIDIESRGIIINIEILFEFFGTPLSKLKPTARTLFNLMTQSANALCLINRAGAIRFEISPTSMAYDEDKNILRMANMGRMCNTAALKKFTEDQEEL